MGLSGKVGGTAMAGLLAAAKAGPEGALDRLRIAGEHVLGVSNSRVPFEEGDLAASGSVSDDGESVVAISYDEDYAVVQHEDMSLKHDAGREAKFLENSLNQERDKILEFVREGAKRRLGL